MIGFGEATRLESFVTASLIGLFSVAGFFLGFGLYPSIGFGLAGLLVAHFIWWTLNGYSLRQIYGDEDA